MSRPVFVVFAGVNGSGKSTFYHSGYWRQECMPQNMVRVNPDEIVREQGGSWSSTADQLRAGKTAIERIDRCLEQGRSFNQETTLSGRRALSAIRKAHEKGFRVFLFFIGVQDAGIALSRIEHRVSLGGHDIDEAAVQRRFRTSLSNLSQAIDYCEEVHVYDNTLAFKRIALWSRDVLAWWGASKLVGSWLSDALLDEAVWLRGAE